MADLTHDTSDDGFHEIQLSGKQLVFLFMATTVVSVVIFLCGVLVGRGIRTERVADVADPTAAGAPAPTDTVADAAPVPPVEAPTPPDEAETPLSYKARLESDKPAAERLKSTVPDKPAPPVPAPASRAASAASASRHSWVVQIVALRDRSTAHSIVQRLNGKGYPAFLVNPAAGAPAPVFKVQVGRYADRDEAEQIRRRLEKEEQFKPWISR